MTVALCGFCPGSKLEQSGPNEADTTIKVASGYEFPICTDCLMDFHESLYNDWLAQQNRDDTTAALEYVLESMLEPDWAGSVGPDPRDSSIDVIRESRECM